jgi:hypothetical protein
MKYRVRQHFHLLLNGTTYPAGTEVDLTPEQLLLCGHMVEMVPIPAAKTPKLEKPE